MKIYKKLLLLLVAFLCGTTVMAQHHDTPAVRTTRAGINHAQGARDTVIRPSGMDFARVTNRYFDEDDLTWYVTVYDTACDRYESTDYFGYVSYTADGVYTRHFVTDEDYDSIVTLHLKIKHSSSNLLPPVSGCDTYTWAVSGETYTESQNINYTLPDHHNVEGCDSILILRLTINSSTSSVTNVDNCGRYRWPANREWYNTSGTYYFTRSNVAGCDSNMTLNLSVWSGDTVTDVQNVCDSYTWLGTEYTSSTITSQHLQNIHTCDSLVTLNLTVRHSTSKTFTANECDRYTWMGTEYTTSGAKRDTILNAVGCDSCMTLNLTIRHSTHNVATQQVCDSYTWPTTGATYAATQDVVHNYTNGENCPSADTLHLTVYYSTTKTDVQSVCDSYTWQGTTYTATTTDQKHLQTVHQCDSLVTLDLTVRHSNSYTEKVFGCYSYDWHGHHYTSSNNTDQWIGTNVDNCDSVVTLNLTIQPFNTDTTNAVACDTYTWNGTTYTSSVTHESRTMPNHFGCDSIDVLNLIINHSNTGIDTKASCDSYTWKVKNADGTDLHTVGTYTASSNTATATVTNAAGCDSVITLHLTINQSNSGVCTVDGCDSYTWKVSDADGSNEHSIGTYTASNNTATATVTNAAGCDSTVHLNLTMYYKNLNGTDNADVCDSYTWNGNIYTLSGTYTNNTLHTVHNCDSAAKLFLTIRHSTTGSDIQNHCDSYTWMVKNADQSNEHAVGTYTASNNSATATVVNQAGCDSLVTLNLTIRHSSASTDEKDRCDSYTWIDGNTYTASTNTPIHTVHNAAGCDSVITLHLTIRNSSDSIDVHNVCDQYTWLDGNTYYASNNTATYDAGTNHAGCDSTVHLALTVRKSTPVTLPAVTRCDSYTWNTSDTYAHNHSHTYTTSGDYRDTLTNRAGCDSVNTLPLTINYSFNITDVQSGCDSYTWHTSDANGSNAHTYGPFLTSATQVANQHTVAGCDSTVTLQLTLYHKDLNGTDNANVCDSIIWNGTKYTTGGTYTYSTQTVHNCDSLCTLTLTVRYSSSSSINPDVCDNYTWHGNNYVASTTDRFVNTNANTVGCDSVEVMHLTVRHSTSSSRTENVCDTFHWDATGLDYTTSNTYFQTLPNSQGCDSNLTLNLTVRKSTESTTNAHGCDYYSWNGVNYTVDTNVDKHFTNAANCDSVAHLHLVMDATIHVTEQVDSCHQCTWHGHTYYYTNHSAATFQTLSVANCDSITTLDLTIHNDTTVLDTAMACDTYIWDGHTYTHNADPIGHFTDRWLCDSTVLLHLTVHHSDDITVETQNVCDSYTWPTNGVTYTTTAMGVKDTLLTQYGCDSIVTLNLTVRHSTASTDLRDSCDHCTWLDGHTYTASTNTPTHTIANAAGCDSVITLNLNIRYSTGSSSSPDVCDSYTWPVTGGTYTSSGTYYKTLTNQANCDSLLTLNLTVRHRSDSTLDVNICDSYDWHGNSYTASTNAPTFDTINAAGCDSTAHLHLVVRYSTTGIDTHDECDSYTWHGSSYTASTDTPTYHTLNSVGCDSTATLHLTIRYSSTRTDADNVCDTYTWVDGNTYTQTNNTATYLVPGGNAAGCDSVARLNLVVRHSTQWNVSDTACDSYSFRDSTYTISTIYPDTLVNAAGCDSVITLFLTMDYTSVYNDVHDTCDHYTWTNGITYTASTNSPVQEHLHTVVGGCDSTSHLHLTIRYSSAYTEVESSCDSFLWVKNNLMYYTTNNTDTVHLDNVAGCDSLITLNLTIRNSSHVTDSQNVCDSLVWHGNTYYANTTTAWWNGTNLDDCDSIVTLDLTVRHRTAGVDEQDICDSITWLDGILYTANNYTAQAVIMNQAGCDSLVTLNLNVRHNSNTAYNATDCDMYIWPRNNTAYNQSQTAYYNYTSLENCPSVDTLYLTINNSSHLVFNETACDTFRWQCHDVDTLIDQSGTYSHTYTNAVLCPSADTLHLNINYNTSTAFFVDTCDSYTWNNHGLDTLITTSGTYLHEYNTGAGCSSTDTLYATIRYSSHLVFDTTVCDLFHWDCHDHHQDYTVAGTYYHEYVNAASCPSADTLKLAVNYNTSTLFSYIVCDSYTWANHGYSQTYDTTGIYTHDYLTAANCPSTDTLDLTVKYNTDTAYTADACDFYTWINNDSTKTYTVGGTYYNDYISNNGCPSVDTLYLTLRYNSDTAYTVTACDTFAWSNNGFDTTLTTSGTYINTYTNGVNCTSTDTLHLTMNYNSDSVYHVQACDRYLWQPDGITYTFSTMQEVNYTNGVGCASTDSLYLTVYYNTNTGYKDTACDMYVWTLNNNTAYNQSGDKYRYYMNADSVCQNVDTLHLVVYHNTSRDTVVNACDTFRWINHGLDSTYYVSGIQMHDYLTIENCPSTDTLHLTVNYNTNSATDSSVCDYFVWNNHGATLNYDTTGTYTHDYLTIEGCPSTDTLHLEVRYNSNSAIDTTACDQFVWNEPDTALVYTIGGTYLHHYENLANCSSTDTLRLVVNYNTSTTTTITACERYLWQSNGITYTFSGDFANNYLTAEGCESIDSLHLTVNYKVDTTYKDTACDSYVWERNLTAYNHDTVDVTAPYWVPGNICENHDTLRLKIYYADRSGNDTAEVCDTMIWHGMILTATNNYAWDSVQGTIHGCDSACVLHLTIHHSSDTVYNVPHACDSYTWDRDSVQFTYTTKGTYTHEYKNEWGCESIDTLQLMVYYNSDTIYIDTACDQYTWRPVHDLTHWTANYTSDTIATRTYTNDVGCTSHDTLYLTVYPSPRGDETFTACDSLLWRDGNIYFESTEFPTDTTPSPVWCDSIITLHLTINHRFELDSTDYFCDSTNYIFHDSIIFTPGSYDYQGVTEHGCDSIIHLELIQLPKPVFTIEESHSCETYEYTLTLQGVNDTFGLPYVYTWSADPTDLTLNGQENDTTIVVHPVKNTVYNALIEYDGYNLPLCANIISTDTLVPVMQPHSIIKTTPPFVQAGDVNFHVEDKSYDYTSRAWYVNGEYWGDMKDFDYTAPASHDDSVALMLISMSPTCSDTAYLLVPIYNFTLYIPNIFTPTEHINKTFKVTGKSVKDFEMWIYTREGLLVYHSTDITEGWDGRHKGELCHQAAYVYHVRYTNVTNPEAWHTVTGTVMLVR